MPAPLIGKVLGGKFELLVPIGEGETGAVHDARSKVTDQVVAIKTIPTIHLGDDDIVVSRFRSELRDAAKVHSPHLVNILEVGHDRRLDLLFVVMEKLEGESLLELVERLGALPPELVARIGMQICSALVPVHEADLVHRNVKPSNVFLAKGEGDERIVKLLDLGVAAQQMDHAIQTDSESLVRNDDVHGSPAYMSPEQARGLKTIDERADLWSAGMTLHHLLLGRAPHAETTRLDELISNICLEDPPLVSDEAPWVSDQLTQAVHGALQPMLGDRHATAAAMRDALAASLDPADQNTEQGKITEDMLVTCPHAAAAGSVDDDDIFDDDVTLAVDRSQLAIDLSPEGVAEYFSAKSADAGPAAEDDADVAAKKPSTTAAADGDDTSPDDDITAPERRAAVTDAVEKAATLAAGPLAEKDAPAAPDDAVDDGWTTSSNDIDLLPDELPTVGVAADESSPESTDADPKQPKPESASDEVAPSKQSEKDDAKEAEPEPEEQPPKDGAEEAEPKPEEQPPKDGAEEAEPKPEEPPAKAAKKPPKLPSAAVTAEPPADDDREEANAGKSRGAMAAIGLMIVAACALVYFFVIRPSDGSPPPTTTAGPATTAQSSGTTTTPQPTASAVGSSSASADAGSEADAAADAAAEAEVVGKVKVFPPFARITVNGLLARPDAQGFLELSGALDSKLLVNLTVGTKKKTVIVVLTKDGPKPAFLVVPMQPAKPPGGGTEDPYDE